jgi:two-component sensor histidine kinase
VTEAAAAGEVRILLLEDSPLDAELVEAYLRRAAIPYRLERVDAREPFAQAVASGRYDLILADYALPSFDGLSALEIARELSPATPFIFVSGSLGEEVAIDSLQRGATDYVLKQRLGRLPSAVRRALDEAAARAERRRAEERQRMLVDELSHRVKNTLATVAAIAKQTMERSQGLADFETAFLSRLRALAEAHDVLFRSNWSDADLGALLRAALAPFVRPDGPEVALNGPAVAIRPKAALTLSLVVHELAVNAAKYGAMSCPQGRIAVDWRLRPGPEGGLALRWRERGGPPVSPPERRGFGSTFIERSVAYEIDGEARLDFAPEGLVCEISFPLRAEAGPLAPA